MSRSSARGAVEPTAALVAVTAVALGLSLYAGVLDEAVADATGTRNRAAATADAVERHLAPAGIVSPGRLASVREAIPSGYEGNVTLESAQRWAVGPTPPPAADTATRVVSVRLGAGVIRRGRLTVRVWR
ncbi:MULTISPECIES: DUF7285 family protein [Haloarcula]|uniref:DUF7285 family protein n=1 Tax=Haloarcula TaxID=2237 RepID=UPI0023EAE7A5|nr:hypothetical protein [Halomicroarcula sp. XH51]